MLAGDTSPRCPRPNGMNGNSPLLRDQVSASSAHDLFMRPHMPIMHKALSDCKRLMRYDGDYVIRMTPNERLRAARIEAGFETAKEAAEALGVPVSTYIGHENGLRGFPAKKAPIYARRFKVTAEWLLYGKNAKPDPLSEDMLTKLIQDAVQEIPANASIGEWPQRVASVLHTQLEQIRAGSEPVDLLKRHDERVAKSQSPVATKRGVAA